MTLAGMSVGCVLVLLSLALGVAQHSQADVLQAGNALRAHQRPFNLQNIHQPSCSGAAQ